MAIGRWLEEGSIDTNQHVSVESDGAPGGLTWKGTLHSLALIAFAALITHGCCLLAPFYLDDQPHILNSPRIVDPGNHDTGTLDGSWDFEGDRYRPGRRSTTYLLWNLVHSLAGFSAPAFHGLNLAIHVLLSMVIYFVVKEFMMAIRHRAKAEGSPAKLALWTSLIFAVHPLGTEATHYAAQTSIQLVTLFTILGAGFALRGIRNRHRRWAGATVASVLAATFSKEVGIFHSSATIALLLLVTGRWQEWIPWAKRRLPTALIVGASILAAIVVIGVRREAFQRAWVVIHNPELPTHLLTQSRVFWEYAWRMILPIRQCSDHFVPRTNSGQDTEAWLAACCLAALVIALVSVALLRRKLRLPTFITGMILVHTLIRFLIPGREVMVEYRLYPAMPWVALLFALAIRFAFQQNGRGATLSSAALISFFALLCVNRSLVWRSEETLVADIVQQYPLHIRSQSYLQAHDYRSGRHDEVIERQRLVEVMFVSISDFNGQQGEHHRSYDKTKVIGSYMACEQFVGYALIEKKQPTAAIARMTNAIEALGPFFDHNRTRWFAPLYRVRGKAKAALGDQKGAIEDYRSALAGRPNDRETLELLKRAQREGPPL